MSNGADVGQIEEPVVALQKATWQRCIGVGLRWRLVSTNGPMLFHTGQYLPTEDRELQQAWVCTASDDPAVSVGTVEWRDVPTVPRGK